MKPLFLILAGLGTAVLSAGSYVSDHSVYADSDDDDGIRILRRVFDDDDDDGGHVVRLKRVPPRRYIHSPRFDGREHFDHGRLGVYGRVELHNGPDLHLPATLPLDDHHGRDHRYKGEQYGPILPPPAPPAVGPELSGPVLTVPPLAVPQDRGIQIEPIPDEFPHDGRYVDRGVIESPPIRHGVVEHGRVPPPDVRPGAFVGPEVALFAKVRVKDRDNIYPRAIPKCIAIRAPHGPGCVFVKVFVPPYPAREVDVEDGGRKLKLDYGDYEVEVESDDGRITIDYDD